MDYFFVGRLSGTVWQYTAIDVASSYVWEAPYVKSKKLVARWTSLLARFAAQELSRRGGEREKVLTDNASEFRSGEFGMALSSLAARHVFIQAGRPQTNGCVERVSKVGSQ